MPQPEGMAARGFLHDLPHHLPNQVASGKHTLEQEAALALMRPPRTLCSCTLLQAPGPLLGAPCGRRLLFPRSSGSGRSGAAMTEVTLKSSALPTAPPYSLPLEEL